MPKMFRFDDQARMSLKSGVDQMAAAVRVTLGPRGRPVLLDRRIGVPILTSDGVTIVRDIQLADPYENLGAQLLREVASKTSELAGDGSTTATLLAQAIVSHGLDAVTAGENPMQLKRGIDGAVEQVVRELKRQARPVSSRAELLRVATLAAHHDLTLGEVVATALERVGSDGIVQVEAASSPGVHLSFVDGVRFDRGYVSAYFVTDAERMEALLESPFVLVTDQTLSSVEPLIGILEQVAAAGASLLLIADDIDGEALATLVLNRLKGTLEMAAVRAPGFGERRRDWLDDLALVTGGALFSEERGIRLADAQLTHLGRARRVHVGRDSTTILTWPIESDARPAKRPRTTKRKRGGAWSGEASSASSSSSSSSSSSTSSRAPNSGERERAEERLSRFRSNIAEIFIGGQSENETLERKSRLEDALVSTRGAVAEGIVAGGGVALLRAAIGLEGESSKRSTLRTTRRSAAEEIGRAIVGQAIESPARAIADNAGYDGAAVVEEILRREDGYGFDAETGEWVDFFGAGVIDPARVARLGLVHAASIGSLILTTETLVADNPDETTDGA